MKRLIRILISACFALASMNAHSQQFPEGASTPTAPDVKKYLDDKVFSVKLADGNSWRLEYKSNGYFYVNTSTGFNGSGQWQVEDGKLCGQLRGGDRSCNDVRFHQELLHLKRNSGEIIQYISK